MSDGDNRRRAAQILVHLPKNLSDALATLSYAAALVRFTSGQIEEDQIEGTVTKIPASLRVVGE